MVLSEYLLQLSYTTADTITTFSLRSWIILWKYSLKYLSKFKNINLFTFKKLYYVILNDLKYKKSIIAEKNTHKNKTIII